MVATDQHAAHGGSEERRNSFDHKFEPFRNEKSLELNDDEVDGSVSFMNPTKASFTFFETAKQICRGQRPSDALAHARDVQRPRTSSGVEYKWTSRNNRKGRHALVVPESDTSTGDRATGLQAVLNGIRRMATCFYFWDISYLGSVAMSAACVFLVTNAFLAFMPYLHPHFQPPEWITVVQGALTLIGCILFLTSSSLSFLEAVNQDQRGCFGWKEDPSGQEDTHEESENEVESDHHTLVPDWSDIRDRNSIGNLFQRKDNENRSDEESTPLLPRRNAPQQNWRWFPSLHDLFNHFLYDLGFIACSFLLCSSITYCASAGAALISIVTAGSIVRPIRVPQLIASIGFVTASALFMLETQSEWWRPNLRSIGWHISFLNLIGSVGFALSAAFPLSSEEGWAQYQLCASFFWGSWGFAIGSVLQWYEAVDKHPVKSREDEKSSDE